MNPYESPQHEPPANERLWQWVMFGVFLAAVACALFIAALGWLDF